MLLAGVCTAWSRGVSAEDGLFDLGTLNGGDYALAMGVSADGNVVVGSARDGAAGKALRAFRWTEGTGMVSLGTLNSGYSSEAFGVSADGRVVVGGAEDGASNAFSAFRWTEFSGMVSLGTLNGGSWSFATGVSADGSVVVGEADDGAVPPPYSAAPRAFRWTQASGLISLGVLNGGSWSSATGVSADGSVVVGEADDGAGANASRAIRWTQATGIVSLGTLNGGEYSYATGVSADGSVVVGRADDGAEGKASRAFRWTQTTGMVSLGALNGGSYSYPCGVSGDGSVVVGQAADGATGKIARAFRWTQATGMQSVEDWLRASGVAVASDMTVWASATNADGSVVVGKLGNSQAFIARVAREGSGLITINDVAQSLASTATASTTGLATAELVLHGAHGRPLARRVAVGERCAYLAGDWGQDDKGSRDGEMGLAEAGGCYNFGPVQANFGVGYTWAIQHPFASSKLDYDGTYIIADALLPVRERLWVTFSGYYHWGDADIRRGYLNAGLPDTSRGNTDTRTWGLRARLDWENAIRLASIDLTPYGELSYVHTHMDAYTEHGGGFPAAFDSRSQEATGGRLGVSGTRPLSADVTLTSFIEGVRRFQDDDTRVSGEVVGLFGFDLTESSDKQSWLRGGLGVEARIAGGVASLMVNAASEGQDPDFWLAAFYQKPF